MNAMAPKNSEAKPAVPVTDNIAQAANQASPLAGEAFAFATLTLGALFTVAWIVVLTWLPGKAFGVCRVANRAPLYEPITKQREITFEHLPIPNRFLGTCARVLVDLRK